MCFVCIETLFLNSASNNGSKVTKIENVKAGKRKRNREIRCRKVKVTLEKTITFKRNTKNVGLSVFLDGIKAWLSSRNETESSLAEVEIRKRKG